MIETIESPYIHAANSEHFTSLLLDNSHMGPAPVNSWSRKAGSCLRQYPLRMDIGHHTHDNYAQHAMLKLFTMLGKESPLVAQYRSNLRRYVH